jgi:flagellar hook-associated protein FlgK|tara:strand:- start:6452 stop:6709 length:258 start_codon:yes stop_codon:yes gene_type:complete
MFKPYKTYKEIPEETQKQICSGNKVNDVKKVPLKDINSFYQDLDNFISMTSNKVLFQRMIQQQKDMQEQLDDIERLVQGIYDKIG